MFRTTFLALALPFVAVSTANSFANMSTIHESAQLGTTGQVFGVSIGANQFVGSRFHLDTAVAVEQVGGHLTGVGTYYAAIVSMAAPSALPSGTPFDGSLLATTVFVPPSSSADVRVPLSVKLLPGDYGLIFGSGRFGASGHGFMLNNNSDIPGHASYFIWTGGASGGAWHEFPANNAAFRDVHFVVEGTVVPEPSAAALLPTLAMGSVGRTRLVRRNTSGVLFTQERLLTGNEIG